MSTRAFQWVVVSLFAAVIVLLVLVGGLLWNQQVEHEAAPAHAASAQHAAGDAEEQSDPSPPPQRAHAEKPAQANPAPGKKDTTHSYQVDADTSRIYVKVGTATRLGHPHGVEGKLKSGQVQLGAGGELTFDMSSFKADTPEARKRVGLEGKKVTENEAKKVNANMQSADVLDVEKFPTATFKIISIKPAEKQEAGAPGSYHLNGRFTLHGAEQPLKFDAKLERTDKEGVLKLSGSFAINQTDYGIKPYSAVGGLAKVADRLDIFGDLFLRPAK